IGGVVAADEQFVVPAGERAQLEGAARAPAGFEGFQGRAERAGAAVRLRRGAQRHGSVLFRTGGLRGNKGAVVPGAQTGRRGGRGFLDPGFGSGLSGGRLGRRAGSGSVAARGYGFGLTRGTGKR